MCQLTCSVIILSFLLCIVESLPNGAPQQACDTLTPAIEGHIAPPQKSPVPYIIDLSPFADDDGRYYYQSGKIYTLSISAAGNNSSLTFRGFLIEARLQVDNKTRIGVFRVLNASSSRLSSCLVPSDGITHSNRKDKLVVSFQWIAPHHPGTGPIRFAFAVVQVRIKYWANVKTDIILERLAEDEATTISGSGSGIGFVSASGSGSDSNSLFAPFGLSVGDSTVSLGDDIAEGPIFLSQPFTFFGIKENQSYIGVNGVISFQQAYTTCCGTREFPQGPPPLIAPFWHDIDTLNGGNIFYRQTSNPLLLLSFQSFVAKIYQQSFNLESVFVVTWDQVAPNEFFAASKGLTNTFQVWLGSDKKASFVIFLYGDLQWGKNAQIGFNAGDNIRSLSTPESLTVDTEDIEIRSNINESSIFVFRVDNLLENVTIPCPAGTYRSEYQEEDCLPCPLNTNTSSKNATICPCLPGYFRAAFEGPEIYCTRPPSTCRNIKALSIEEQSVNLSWSKPDDTGRDDFYYSVKYSDGESTGAIPFVTKEKIIKYSISGLKPATYYTFMVTVENGVSDQDTDNEYLRRCELKLTTLEGRPSPPVDFQPLCEVIVWGVPSDPNGDIVGYEAQFFIPGTQTEKMVEIANDRTFYTVKQEDKLDGDTESFVRVRAKTRTRTGQWSVGKSLGCDLVATTPISPVCPPCDCPTCPPPQTTDLPSTVAPTSSVYFVLHGQIYNNNSVLSLIEVGEEENALLCKTNLVNCCGQQPHRFGQFYYPNGTLVPVRSVGYEFYRNRGDQEVRLHRRRATSPNGRFRCEIPDANEVYQNLYINLI